MSVISAILKLPEAIISLTGMVEGLMAQVSLFIKKYEEARMNEFLNKHSDELHKVLGAKTNEEIAQAHLTILKLRAKYPG